MSFFHRWSLTKLIRFICVLFSPFSLQGKIRTERLLRLNNGFPTTEREQEEFDKNSEKNRKLAEEHYRGLVDVSSSVLILFAISDISHSWWDIYRVSNASALTFVSVVFLLLLTQILWLYLSLCTDWIVYISEVGIFLLLNFVITRTESCKWWWTPQARHQDYQEGWPRGQEVGQAQWSLPLCKREEV